jgi:cyclophilin family peptidyl-prolyl cis-trans isomerase
MAKRRRQIPARSRVFQAGEVRPGFSRRQEPQPTRQWSPIWWVVGAVALVVVLLAGSYALGFFKGAPAASPSPSSIAAATPGTPRPDFNVGPPSATPMASPLAAPAGDGTTATIETDLGSIVFEIYNESAPVASENFINLASAGFYDGIVFHRIVPDFMIQGGDPLGTGTGGPDYRIPDEPVVGNYTRGTVAMARSSAPDSQGSQFFIVVKDSPFLAGGGYTIFGNVLSGMDVVDQIVSMPSANDDQSGQGGTALDPVVMNTVTIQQP